MWLRNKKTGKIVDANSVTHDKGIVIDVGGDKYYMNMYFSTLAELNEEWEEYEDALDKMKLIGNYFETKEEAEKAVEKLKAWKRLEDNGFRFKKYSPIHMSINYGLSEYYDEAEKDLDLLFGGEE